MTRRSLLRGAASTLLLPGSAVARMGGAPPIIVGPARTPISSMAGITGPGNYIATGNFTGNFTMNANNVDLDMAGHVIGAGSTGVMGIAHITGTSSGIILRNALIGTAVSPCSFDTVYGDGATVESSPPAVQIINCTAYVGPTTSDVTILSGSNIIISGCTWSSTSNDDTLRLNPNLLNYSYYCKLLNSTINTTPDACFEGLTGWAYCTFTGNTFGSGSRALLGEYGAPTYNVLGTFGLINNTITGNTMSASGETIRFDFFSAHSDAAWVGSSFTASTYTTLGSGSVVGFNVISGNTYV
jgi:hypothetical protein